ncbi:MAG: type II secretion system protein N [Methylovulum sp.]|nr:type II secretion system protein N [Methylovulum sp.]
MKAGHKQIALTLVACMLGSFVAYLQYSLPQDELKTVRDAEWKLPALAKESSENLNAYNTLSRYYPKTTSAVASQGGANQPGQQTVQAWTLQGLVQERSKQYALIKTDNKIKRYRIGEQLPDSSILTAINNNGIIIDVAGKLTAISLHGGRPR